MKARTWEDAVNGERWLLLIDGRWSSALFQSGGDGMPAYFYGPGVNVCPMYPSEAASIEDSRLETKEES